MKIHVESKLDKPVYVNLICSTSPIEVNKNSIQPQILTENRSIDVNMEGECFNAPGYILQVWDALVYNQDPKTYVVFDKGYMVTTKVEKNDISIDVVKTFEEGVLHVQLNKKRKLFMRILLALALMVVFLLIGFGGYVLVRYIAKTRDKTPSGANSGRIPSITLGTTPTPSKINPILK